MYKKKILIVANLYSHIAQFHKPFMNLLKSKSYEIHVFGKDNLSEKDNLKLDEPNKKFSMPMSRNPLSFINLRAFNYFCNLIINEKYDIVYGNTPIGGLFTRLSKLFLYKKFRFTTIYTAHGFHFYKGAPLFNWIIFFPIEFFLSFFTDKLITINNEDYELSKKFFKCKIFHIHGVGVNKDRFQSLSTEAIQQFKVKNDLLNYSLILLVIGELNNNKNQITLIKSINLLKNDILGILLLIAGNGKNLSKLQHYVKKKSLNNNVRFLGYRKNIEFFIHSSDLIVSASKREGLPFNILEGMISKKVIIASSNRGHNELIVNNSNGFIINKFNDHKSFANKIKEFYNFSEKLNPDSAYISNLIENYMDYNVILQLEKIFIDN